MGDGNHSCRVLVHSVVDGEGKAFEENPTGSGLRYGISIWRGSDALNGRGEPTKKG
jgi:hypothetical protein